MVNLTTRQVGILRLLINSELHAYKIKTELQIHDKKISFGSLYPSLKRLEKLDLIASKWHDEEKKTYSTTAKGKTVYEESMQFMNGSNPNFQLA